MPGLQPLWTPRHLWHSSKTSPCLHCLRPTQICTSQLVCGGPFLSSAPTVPPLPPGLRPLPEGGPELLNWAGASAKSVQNLPSTQKGPHTSTLSAPCPLPEATLHSPVPTLEYSDRSSEATRPCSHIPCLPVASGQPCSQGRPGERDEALSR